MAVSESAIVIPAKLPFVGGFNNVFINGSMASGSYSSYDGVSSWLCW